MYTNVKVHVLESNTDFGNLCLEFYLSLFAHYISLVFLVDYFKCLLRKLVCLFLAWTSLTKYSYTNNIQWKMCN